LRRILFVVAVVFIGTSATVAYELNFGRFTPQSVPVFVVSILGSFALITSFAVWTAARLQLPTSLLFFDLPVSRRWVRFLGYGVGFGILIFLTNRAVYLTSTTRPLRPWYVASIESHIGLFVLAARSALLEETFFRLFGIPFIASLVMRALYGWRPRMSFDRRLESEPADGMQPPLAVLVLAVVASALLFGLHHPFSPLPAVAFGLTLGVIYLRAGWESAVVAHFLGNYLPFASIYL
jgi:hypothetical protein